MHIWHGRLNAESNRANPSGLEHQTAPAVTTPFIVLNVTDWINIHRGENHGHVEGIQGKRSRKMWLMGAGVIIGCAGSLLTDIRHLLKR